MTETVRRRICWALVIAAPLVAWVTLVSAVDAQHGRHLYLRWLAQPFLGAVTAFALIVLVGGMPSRQHITRAVVQTLAGLLGLGMVLIGAYAGLNAGLFKEYYQGVVATSPDHRLVSYRAPGLFSSDLIMLRVQSRAGLLSREGGEDVACFSTPMSDAGPEWLFDRADFTGRDQITVYTRDGRAWPLTFDTRTLLSPQPVDRCTNAPDTMAD